VARRYGFSLFSNGKTIFYERVQRVGKILFLIFYYIDNKTSIRQNTESRREITEIRPSINSRVRLWKIISSTEEYKNLRTLTLTEYLQRILQFPNRISYESFSNQDNEFPNLQNCNASDNNCIRHFVAK